MTNNTYPFYIVYLVLTFERTFDTNVSGINARFFNFLFFITLAFTPADTIITLLKVI